jgi:fibronectin-binding autotransporter adhesin
MKTRQPKTFGKLLSALVGGVTLGSKTTTRKNMKTTTARTIPLIAGLLLAATLGAQAQTTITKSGTTTMNTAADWIGGAPTNSTVGQFTGFGGAFTLGGNVTFAGLNFLSTTPSFVTIANTGSFTNTLDTSWYTGAAGIVVAPVQTVTFNNVTKLNGAQTWNVSAPGSLTINGALLTTGVGVDLANFGGTLTGTSMTNVNGILGPWATTASGTSYATISGGVISAFTAGVPLPIFGGNAATNYTVAGNTVITVNESANTIQTTGGAIISGSRLTVNGILNSGNVLTNSSGMTIGANLELVISGNGTTRMNGVISDNGGGASAMTFNGFGSGLLQLNAANNFTGNVLINSGTVSDLNAQNSGLPLVGGLGNPQIAGRTVTINNGGILSLDAGGGNDFGGGSTIVLLGFVINPGGLMQVTTGNVTVGPVTLNGGTLYATPSAGFSQQFGSYEFGGDITVGANTPPSTISSDGNFAFNLTVNAGSGALRTFNVGTNSTLTVAAQLWNSSNTQNPSTLVKAGPGTLVLNAANTSGATNIYSGGTIVSNGTLTVLTGGAGTGPVTVNGGKLGGSGTILGNVVVNNTGHTLPGGGMTTTIGGNLTYNTGGEADFTLSNSHNGANDQIILNGASSILSGSGVNVGIQLTDLVSTNLDKTADYLLITNYTGNDITGVFAPAPVFLGGLTPTNAANFSVVTFGNYVVLHFSPIIFSSALATPNPAGHNQLVSITVTATTTAPGAAITNITVNASAAGGSPTLQLFPSGVANTYTNSVTVSPAIVPGNLTLTATALDNAGDVNALPILLVVIPLNEVWNGASPTNTWATGTNWVSGIAPLIGDLVTFAGTSNNTVNLESSYSISALTFSTNAASFNITNAANTLTLTGSVTNNSTNTQFLSVPVSLAAVQTFNAVSNNLVFSNAISGAGGVTTAGNSTNVFISANSYTGRTTVGGNLLLASGGALGGSTNVTLNNGSKVLLRADASIMFTTGNVTNFAQNASDTLNFDLNTNLANVTGRTLSLTNVLFFPNVSGQTINVRGNSTYALSLGEIKMITSSHNPYFAMTVNTVTTGPQALIGAITTGDWGNYVNFAGGGNATVAGILSNTSNGSVNLFVTGNSTLTLGPLAGLVKANTGDAYRCDVISGTLVLDNSSALNALNFVSGTGIGQSLFILGPASSQFTISGTISPASGVLITANNSSNAAVFLGDSNNLTGGLSVAATITNNVSDGDTGFTNGGVFTIGGQNTSGVNTYNNPIILGLTANKGKNVTLVATAGGEVDFTGGILANGTNTTAGVTVGDATHTGTVAFTGGSLNTYAGGTTVTNSILRVDNNSSSSVGSGAVSVNNLGVLASRANSGGIVSGNVIVNSGGVTLPGSTNGNTIGSTLAISGNLTYNVGGAANFNLSPNAGGYGSGSGNDLISLNQISSILSGTNVAVGIKLTGAGLDTADYTLVNQLGGNFAGVFTNMPTWLGATPANAANYSIVTYDTYVALHYNPAGMTVVGSITPNPASHGQTVTIKVTATATGGISTVDVIGSTIPSASGLHLSPAGGNLFTASFTIDATVGAGVQLLTVQAQDNFAHADSVPVLLTTVPVNEVWDGNGIDNRWATGINWVNNLTPASGDLMTFTGTKQTTPNMENNYTVSSVTFTNAGSFNITNANNVLTLVSGVTNTSANVQTLGVQINLPGPTFANPTGASILNAVSNNIVITTNISGPGGVVSLGATNTTNTLAGNNFYNGITKVNSGVLVLSANNTVSNGTVSISGGTLVISGAGQLDSGNFPDNLTNNGTFIYSGTNNQSFTGIMSGTGGLTLNSPTNTVLTLGSGTGGVAQNPYTYTGPTVVNSGELDLNFANQGVSGLYLSSGLTINNGGKVVALGSSALMGFTAQGNNLPITINPGGLLTASNLTIFAAHLYGVLTLKGGTLGDIAVPDPTFGGWDINNTVVVNGGVNTSFITDPYCIPGKTGGTIFNVTNGGTASGIDLDIVGSFVGNFSGSGDTGVIVTNNGTMAYETTNTYNNFTGIGAGATLILNTNALMLASNLTFYAGAITNNGTFIENSTNAQTFRGVIFGTGTFNVNNPSAVLTLTNANSFAGSMLINQGTLLVANTTGSATGSGSVSVNNGGRLGGHGGSISGNTTFNPGGRAVFNLDSTFNSVNNDQISFNGGNSLLTPNNGVVGINVTNGSLAAADYVLMKYVPGTISGVFSNAPVWLGATPGNPNNYSIVTLSNTVVLHYATGGFVLTGSASPNPAARSQLVTFTVHATGANTITAVTLNASSIGGSSAVPMVFQSGNTWTASVGVSSTTPAGGGVLPFTVQDNAANTGLSSVALTVLPAIETWTGLGSPNTWVTGANWVSGLGPIAGDLLNFAGSIQTNVNMETNYTIGSLTFSNNAGSFNLTNNGANTLTLNGSVTNNSASPQIFSVPINVTAVQNFNAAAGNLTVSNVITGIGGVSATGAATATNLFAADNTYTGTTAVNGGVLVLAGSETIFGQMSINAGTLLFTGRGQLNGGNFSGNVLDNGSLNYSGTNSQQFTGSVFGTGGLTVNTPTNITVTYTGTNSYNGNLVINSGILSDQNNQNGSLNPIVSGLGNTTVVGKTVTINSGGILSVDASGFLGNGSSVSAIGFIVNSNGLIRITTGNSTMGSLTLNGGTLNAQTSGFSQAFGAMAIGGPITVGGNSPSYITNSFAAAYGLNLAINNLLPSKTITVADVTGDSNVDLYISAPLNDSSGTGNPGNITTVALIKAGAGTMQLSGTNLYSGGTIISAGTIIAGNGDNMSPTNFTSNPPTGPGNVGGANSAGALGKPLALVTLGDTNTTLNSASPTLLIGGAFNVNHPIIVSTNPTTGTYTIGGRTDNNSSFSNLVTLNQPLTISQAANVGANALILKGGINSGNGLQTVKFTGPGNMIVANTGMSDGSGQLAVAVTGGTLIVSATNSYSGGTAVTGGATVGGSGVIAGFTTNNAGGNLVPGVGTGGVGTVLTISNLTMLAGSTNLFVVSHNLHLNDNVVSLAVTYGGTLNVTTNAGDGALVAGDSFKLFNSATAPVGSFAAVNLPALGAGLGWNNTLSVNGSISVVTTTTTTPTIGNVVFSGGNLIMSGSNGTPFATYRILSTNTLPPSTSVAPWPTVFTGAFDVNGNYIYTNPVTGGASFFRLATP